jgi:magnesium-transporting ATPase (P-type)
MYTGDVDRNKIPSMEVDGVFSTFDTSMNGLIFSEAKRRQARFGPNTIQSRSGFPLLKQFVRQFTNLFAVLLVVASVLAYLGRMPQLSIAIIMIVIINGVIGFIQELVGSRIAKALSSRLPSNARIIREGSEIQLPTEQVTIGDLLLLQPGDRIPADARIIESHNLSVNNDSVTGEALPQPRDHHPIKDIPLFHASNVVFQGTTVSSGFGMAVVYSIGKDTELGKMAKVTHETRSRKSPLELEINMAAKLIAVIATIIGALFGIFTLGMGEGWVSAFVFGIGVVVALVPEGLIAVVSVSLFTIARRLARKNVLVKRLSASEALGSTTVICTDKTGTLTKGEMTVQYMWVNGHRIKVSGVGYIPTGDFYWDGNSIECGKDEKLDPSEVQENLSLLLKIGTLANTSVLVGPKKKEKRWAVLGSPTEGAILTLAQKAHMNVSALAQGNPRRTIFPFDRSRKMMSTIHSTPEGAMLFLKGAPDVVLHRSTKIRIDGNEVPIDEGHKKEIMDLTEWYADRALRTLAVAYRPVDGDAGEMTQDEVEHDLVFIGVMAMLDPPRDDVRDAIKVARNAGVRIVMITGDFSRTAFAIAKSVGLTDCPDHDKMVCQGGIIVDTQLDAMSDPEVKKILAREDPIFSRISPLQKLRIVRLLQEMGEIVAVTGDGVNDAPALKRADVGIAMGLTGTDVAREAADIVLLQDNFATIVEGIEYGRSVFRNLRKVITFIFSSNFAELMPFIFFIIFPVPLLLPVILVLCVDLGADLIPCFSLGVEPPEKKYMKMPPRKRTEHLLDLSLLGRAFIQGMAITVVSAVSAFYVLQHGGWHWGDEISVHSVLYLEACTATFAGIMVGQAYNLLAMRSTTMIFFQKGMKGNKFILPAYISIIVAFLLIIYVPFANDILGTRPFPVETWIIMFALGPLVLLTDTVFKMIRKALSRRSAPSE